MARRVRRPNSRGGARDPTRNQTGSTWGGGVSSTPGGAPTGSRGGVRTPTPTGSQRGNTWGGNVASTPGGAPTGFGGGVNVPSGAQGSVITMPDGTRRLLDVNSPLPPGAVVEPGGYPRPDGNTPEQRPATPPPPPRPTFDGSSPDELYTTAEGQRQRALASMLDSARGGEATTGLDYGFGFTRYAADVKDPAGNVIHRAGEVDQTSYTQPTSFTSGDTVGGYGNTDPNNPFSRASMLHRSYANANSVSSGSFANRGQLGSGAYQRAQGRNTMGYDQGRDSLLKGFAARLGEFQTQRNTAYNTNDTTGNTNSSDLFQRNLSRYNANYPSS